ncbi:MAG: peptidoglycan recognition family protein [Phycisphaerales bacterium]
MAANSSLLGLEPDHVPAGRDPLFDLPVEVDGARWRGIVIHHLGRPSGDVDAVDRLHRSVGIKDGIGFHFLIGNGNGLDNGVISITDRWREQRPGVHVPGEAGAWHNEHSIAICLVGNGDRRAFEDRQIESLAMVIRRLQEAFDIPADQVHMASELNPRTTGPGRYFPRARLTESILP